MTTAEHGRFVLLTGAGFTKNWGAKLAAEIWADLIGCEVIQADASAREALLQETAYEAALARALDGEFGPTAYLSIVEAVGDAFISMDRHIQSALSTSGTGVDTYRFQEFLRMFLTKSTEGYIFTLNQDLLIERILYNLPAHAPVPALPGVPQPTAMKSWSQLWFSSVVPTYSAELEVILPSASSELSLGDRYNYIKLHGSLNWRDEAGHQVMVMGGDKPSKIGASWLLQRYFEIFKAVLDRGDVRLMTVGYGFADPHVNALIEDAALNHGLSIHIWDTRPQGAMLEHLNSVPGGSIIWNKLIGYTPQPIQEVFPSDGPCTEHWRKIGKEFFSAEVPRPF